MDNLKAFLSLSLSRAVSTTSHHRSSPNPDPESGLSLSFRESQRESGGEYFVGIHRRKGVEFTAQLGARSRSDDVCDSLHKKHPIRKVRSNLAWCAERERSLLLSSASLSLSLSRQNRQAPARARIDRIYIPFVSEFRSVVPFVCTFRRSPVARRPQTAASSATQTHDAVPIPRLLRIPLDFSKIG